MSTILAGHFQLQDEVNHAREELLSAGFADEQISRFYLSQAGQHNLTPIGGDHLSSPGAKEAPRGMVAGELGGGAVGAAVGAVAGGPLGAVVGGAVGAHVGSLYSFNRMKERGESEAHGRGEHGNEEDVRRPGMMLAVEVHTPSEEDAAMNLLRRLGAHHIERADGHIERGDWIDFDPNSTPHVIHEQDRRAQPRP